MHLENNDPSSSHLCTVVFELVPQQRHAGHRWGDPGPRSFTRLLPINLSRPGDSAGLRVVYDRTHPCTEGSHSVFSFLRIRPHEIYGPHAAPDPHTEGRCGTHRRRTAVMPVTVHNLRLLQTSHKDRHPPPQLPPEVLLLIGKYAIAEPSKRDWRKRILTMTLVCQSWAHLANLFFQLLDDCGEEEEKPSPERVARSLALQPQRAKLVRKFSPSHYKGFELQKKSPLSSWREIVKILKLTTSVEEVSFYGVHQSILPDFLQALSLLQKVERLRIISLFRTRAGNADRSDRNLGDLSMPDIQTLVSNWPCLEKIVVLGWVGTR